MPVHDLYDFAHRIAIADPSSPKDRSQMLDELRRRRRELKERSGNDLGGCLDAAVVLVAYLSEDEASSANEVLQIVSRLICITAQNISAAEQRRALASPTPEPPSLIVPREESLNKSADEKHIDLTAASEVRLGEVLVRLKHVTIRDVEMALLHQRQTGVKLGQALVEIGATGHEEIQEALDVQGKVRTTGSTPEGNVLRMRSPENCLGEKPADADLRLVSDTMLGETLIRRGAIDQHQLEEAIMVQRATGIRIGEALVEIGAICWEDLENSLRRQKERTAKRQAAGDAAKTTGD